jgi:hypothetical protein
MQTSTGTVKPIRTRSTAVHHLFVDVAGFACNVGEEAELLVSLFDLHSSKYLRLAVFLFVTVVLIQLVIMLMFNQ